MKSVSGKYWEEEKLDQRIIDKIKYENNFTDIISRLIVKNKFNKDEIYSVKNNLELFNPFQNNPDFLSAFKIFEQSINNKHKIYIIGDYDVDGCISVSLIVKVLKILKTPYNYYIPNRFRDGYGTNIEMLKSIVKEKPKLIIMVDNGSNAVKSIDYLNKHKIKTIIIDHHEIYKPYPKCGSLINPQKIKSYNNYNYFCAAALTYFFLDIFLKKKSIKSNFKENLILVLTATIADVMPLRKINRVIAINVMRNINKFNNNIFKKIFEIKKIKKQIEIDDFAFLFSPIINSIGRLGDAHDVIELFTTKNYKKRDDLILKLISTNEKRKSIEDNCIKKINLKKIISNQDPIIFLHLNNIHEGIIGIIASRLKNYFNKPCIVITKSGNTFKGSSRSNESFNIGFHIKKALDLNIIINGGGHNLAAGFSLKKNNVGILKKFLINKYYKKNIKTNNNYISEISFHALNTTFSDEINILSPYGEGILKPLFLVKNVKILNPKIIKNKIISCFLKTKISKMLPAVSFNHINSEITENILYNKNEVNLIVQLSENFWNNKKRLQINIVDLIYDLNKA